MLLAIDVGNTHALYGLHHGERWIATWRQHTDPLLTEDEIATFVGAMIAQERAGAQVTRVAVCSVVPAIDERLQQYAEQRLGLKPFFVRHDTARGLKIRIEPPESVGADRIANAAAALHHYGRPVIVVDLGTATTFDAISPEGEYLGGAIMPGVEISMSALFHRAAKLNKISLWVPENAIGRSTEDSLRSGIVLGNAAAIDGLVTRIAAELGGQPTVVATGGVSKSIVDACRTVQHVDPMLTLEGIRLLAQSS
jgi:type III pantothenate kinase